MGQCVLAVPRVLAGVSAAWVHDTNLRARRRCAYARPGHESEQPASAGAKCSSFVGQRLNGYAGNQEAGTSSLIYLWKPNLGA